MIDDGCQGRPLPGFYRETLAVQSEIASLAPVLGMLCLATAKR
jgi:hypothetical protein